ncbi:MAG: NAD(P)/FAD-dependent oxidoreductase [Lachnospirales bacterium]
MYRYSLKLNIDSYYFSEDELLKILCEKLKLNISNVKNFSISKKSIDARNKKDIKILFALDFNYNKKINNKNLSITTIEPYKNIYSSSKQRPIIIGSGPSGLFCGLILAEAGLRPIILEQGKNVDGRKKDVDALLENGTLNEKSNIQFGEGGAGTFSDGKLTTGVKDHRKRKVMETFVAFGAPKEILYLNKPHIGTDNLIKVVTNLRNKIIELGGEVHFESEVTDFYIENNEIQSITINNQDKIKSNYVVLAIGHSSRNTFYKLYSKGLNMENKPFAVGFRIEHSAEFINNSQYGDLCYKLPTADYKMATNISNKGVYTFCMCPGGVVVPAQSEVNTIVTNGMSNYKRDAVNSNSAILVSINENDYGKKTLNTIEYQRNLEKLSFKIGNGCAPIQLTEDFLNNKTTTKLGDLMPSFKPKTSFADINNIFPDLNSYLKEGLKAMDKKIKGFTYYPSIITAVESRSSSPIKILRDQNFNSSIKGLIPCGEGCGYAGGITSSAIDGIRCAEKIIEGLN